MQPVRSGPERPPGASDRAYAWIRERILRFELVPGTFLGEHETAAAVGVSRTPVREAFRRLSAEGLLQLLPQRGACVTPIGPREVDEVLQAREVVELDAVRRLTAAGTVPLVRLGELVAVQAEHARCADWSAFIATDREFHRVLQAQVGNAVLLRFYDSLRDQQMRMGMAAVTSSGPRADQVLAEHRAIWSALGAGDVEAAERAVRAHLQFTRECLYEALAAAGAPVGAR